MSSEVNLDIGKLILTLEASGQHYDLEKINKAFRFASELHEGQFRNSGEKYISHPVAVAEIVASLSLDTDAICAALLHDTIEDCGTKITLAKLRAEFGEDVAYLVDGLTKLVNVPFEDKDDEHMENLRKMFLAMSKDVRVVIIKLCDRLHNMRTLSAKPEKKQRITALETMQIYAPLAHRLGMQRIKQELERLSMQYLDPMGFKQVQDIVEERYGKNQGFIENARKMVEDKLTESGIHFKLEGRIKTVYSIYRKMFEQNKSFDEIYDFYALRVIVDTMPECYTVLGLVHDMFKSVPGRFKDYISTPKPNGYKSLHTTVIGRGGIPFEVQIRTEEMHRLAEYGVAAHWKYKTGDTSGADIDKKLAWISKLIESEDDTRDPDEFLRALKIDIYHDEVFVFTPRGDIVTLPQGATLIDFAYTIHSQVGNSMVGAKINGVMVPIDRCPENGNIVEVITSSSSKGPSRDWLKIVKTGEARTKIRQWFKKEKRAENIVVGRTELERELRKYGRRHTDAQVQEILTNVAARVGIQSADDLCNTIGYGGLPVSKISGRLRDEYDRVVKSEPEEAPVPVPGSATPRRRSSVSGIVVDGVEGCAVKLARCCNPLPGDKIIGFITKGYGISIHKKDCPNVRLDNEPDRWVGAYWDLPAESGSAHTFEAVLHILAENRAGLLFDISGIMNDMKISMESVNTQKKTGLLVLLSIGVRCKDIAHMNLIISRLKAVPGVESVTR